LGSKNSFSCLAPVAPVMQRKDYPHNPTHIFADDTAYFITAAIFQKRPLLQNPQLKQLLLERIKLCFDKHKWELHHWVILDNVDNLYDYPFSSFQEALAAHGPEKLRRQFQAHAEFRTVVLREAYEDDF
jgi:hypothetical protein